MQNPQCAQAARSLVGHRGDRHRRRVRMPAHLARAALEQHARRFHRQRRHRVRLAAPRVERAGARQPGHADFPLDLGVVGLEFVVRDRPVGERRARDCAEAAALVEVDLVQAPEVRGEVHGTAADVRRVPRGRKLRDALRLLRRGLAERLRVRVELVGERAVEPVVQFVVAEVRGREARTLLEHQHLEPGLRQLACHHSARGPRSHHDEVDGVVRLELARAHDCCSAAFAYGTNPAYSAS